MPPKVTLLEMKYIPKQMSITRGKYESIAVIGGHLDKVFYQPIVTAWAHTILINSHLDGHLCC